MAGKGVCIAGDAGLIAAAVTVGVSAGSVFTTAGTDICIVGDVVIVGVVTPVLQPTKKTLIKMQMAVKGLSISRNKDGSLMRDVSKKYLYLAAQRFASAAPQLTHGTDQFRVSHRAKPRPDARPR
jgi:hypothetical protein